MEKKKKRKKGEEKRETSVGDFNTTDRLAAARVTVANLQSRSIVR